MPNKIPRHGLGLRAPGALDPCPPDSAHLLRERIEQILLQPGSVSAGGLQETADTYTTVIRELNQRLAICNRWLDAGLRSEAIHMASLEPDLLDAMGQLDLGESLQDWVDLCTANNAAVPPRANWELAAFINDAWDKETQLTDALRSFRLAMLTHRDVSTKLTRLRALLVADPSNAAWDTMTREHEKLRIIELRTELQAASQANNLKRVSLLTKELQSSDWLEPPPADAVEDSTQIRERVATQHVQREFKKLADRLHATMSAGDEAKALHWRSRWNDTKAISGLKPPEDVESIASAVTAWLDELASQREAKRAHGLACRELTIGLDSQRPMKDLEPLHYRISQTDAGVPDLLERRYQDRASQEARSKRARFIMRAGVTATVLSLVAVGTVYIIGWFNAASLEDTYTASLRDAILREDVPLITEIIAQGQRDYPDLLRGELIRDRQQAESLIEAWNQEREECKSKLATLSSTSPGGISGREMEDLKRICKTQPELDQFAALKRRRDDAISRSTATARQQFDIELKQATQTFEEVDAVMGTSSAIPENLIKQCEKLLETLNKLDAPPGQAQRVANLQSQIQESINSLQQGLEDAFATDFLQDQLRTQGVAFPAIINALTTIHHSNDKSFKDHKAIKKVLDQAEKLVSINTWNALRRQFPDDLLGIGPEEAAQLRRGLDAIGANPIVDDRLQRDLANYLQSIERIHDPANSPDVKLEAFLDPAQPWASRTLLRLVTTDGLYYANGTVGELIPPDSDGDSWMLKGYAPTQNAILNGPLEHLFFSDHKRPKNVRGSEFQLEPTGIQAWLTAVKAVRMLERPPAEGSTWHLDLLTEAAQVKDMAPTLRLALMARLAHLHQTCGWPKLPELEEAATAWNTNPPEWWPDPDANHAQRKKARTIVRGLQTNDIAAWRRRVLEAIDQIGKKLPPRFAHVGLVWRDTVGNKLMIIDDDALGTTGKCDIYAIAKNGNWKRVAIRQGGITLEPALDQVDIGMPLFALVANVR